MQIEIVKNGSREYKKVVSSGACYYPETPDEVIEVMERLWHRDTRIQIFYGNRETGADWNEEHDTIGRIGRSTGTFKIPLLIHNTRSLGGGSILTHCILKIIDTKTKEIYYQASNYQAPQIDIVPSDLPEYTHNLVINGSVHSRHKSEKQAKRLMNKLLGK